MSIGITNYNIGAPGYGGLSSGNSGVGAFGSMINSGAVQGAASTARAYGSLPQLPQQNLAALQAPTYLSGAASQLGQGFNMPSANSIQLPSWLSANPDSNLGELLQSYAGVQTAFDPTGQVAARNAAIGYNTSAGGQAANNAASEYANRASQTGASALGAGVVKAQAMMPVLSQNAQLRTQAADVAAQDYQQGASLASQIANNIDSLRTSYLSTLTGYTQGQQQMQLDAYKTQQSSAASAAQLQQSYASLQNQAYGTQLQGQLSQEQLAQSQNAQAIQAAQFQQQLAAQQQTQTPQQPSAQLPKAYASGTTYTNGYGQPISSQQLYGA